MSWTLTADDLEYVGLDSRYILEAGEFQLGLGPDMDCRSGSSSCSSFKLVPTANYNPVCDTGCQLWSRPICGGSPVDKETCLLTCASQQWTWNYVECLEQAGTACNEGTESTMQCFDAFAVATSTGVESHPKESSGSRSVNMIALSSVLSALGGALVASTVAFMLMRQQRAYYIDKMHESSVMLLENEKTGVSRI